MAETLKNYSGSEKQYDLDDMQALLSSEVAALKSEL
jgi:hypothetical protein